MNHWPFAAGPDTLASTTVAILDRKRPVLFVEHDAKGYWHVYDGSTLFNLSDVALAPLRELLDQEPALAELADLPKAWRAMRTDKDSPWERESSVTLGVTWAKSKKALAELQRTMVPLPPGSPDSVELIRRTRNA